MRPLPRLWAVLGIAGGSGLILLGIGGLATSAEAVVTIDGGQPGILSLESAAAMGWSQTLEPGDVVRWPITTMLDADEDGELDVTFEHAGQLVTPGGLQLIFERCDEPWSSDPIPTCASGTSVIAEGPVSGFDDGTVWHLGEITPGNGPFFLVTLWLPETMSTHLQGTTADVALGFTALGDTATVTTPPGVPGLPRTGANVLPGLWLAIGITTVGLIIARQRAGVTR